jgi:hypothetical protein
MSSILGLSKVSLSIVCIFLGTTGATAETSPLQDIRSLNMHAPSCTVEAAFEGEYWLQLRDSSRVSDGLLITLEKFETLIASRAWADDQPMGEQMTPEEANTFGNLQERMLIGNLSSLIESKRERDIQVISQMIQLAEDHSNNPSALPKSESEDEFLLGVVLALREINEVGDQDVEAARQNQGSCTLENALRAKAVRIADGINDIYGLSEAFADLEQLSAKYSAGFDEKTMSRDDFNLWKNRIQPVVSRAFSEAEFAKDLLRLAELESISKIMLETRRSDQYSAPGDLEYAGTTWNQWLEQGRISSTQQDMSGAINLINERIPAEVVNQWEQMVGFEN